MSDEALIVYVRTIGFTPQHYEFFDEQRQPIVQFELTEGKSYIFIALESLSSHPFQLNNDASRILRSEGDSFQFIVPPGVESIEYICTNHSTMRGSIPVKKAALQKFQRDQYKDFQIQVQALKDFINFEAKRADGSLIQRNVCNFDLFADGGRSNPSYSVFVFQRELNIALKNQNMDKSTIREDGFFGVNTAKALQILIKSYMEDPTDKLPLDGKIVSSILTSKALGKTIDAMIKNNEPFVVELLRFIENHGTIQQPGVFPLATNTVIVPFIDV
jgi:hypothetical protein